MIVQKKEKLQVNEVVSCGKEIGKWSPRGLPLFLIHRTVNSEGMEKERQKCWLENGSKLLEERIAFGNGGGNPIKTFSADKLHEAIEDFRKKHPLNSIIDFTWCKGIMDGRLILIKKYFKSCKEAYQDNVITSHMSTHNNVLKLLGCCLELPGPALEVASAVAYLHTAFSKRIVHRDVKPENIFLDHNFAAKLSDFSLCISIPEGESRVKDCSITGTWGFLDPNYVLTEFVTEKTDVFSFGVFMLVLLTEQPAFTRHYSENGGSVVDHVEYLVERDRFDEVPGPGILENGRTEIEPQLRSELQAFTELALRCTHLTGEDRPSILEVAQQLQKIYSTSIADP
ncbi:receptor protein kinase, putative [Ricinus communis]|uniref:Receptor protein kinase, putative n=1 Tax=Ricinus communis TaxID=3988 RepID=B9R8U4_RICCO|nr:receptor protein kinase, putative [Ricinus communis]